VENVQFEKYAQKCPLTNTQVHSMRSCEPGKHTHTPALQVDVKTRKLVAGNMSEKCCPATFRWQPGLVLDLFIGHLCVCVGTGV